MDKVSHGSFKVKVVDGVIDLDREKNKSTIPGISSYYNFQYTDEGIRIWQAFGIGEGNIFLCNIGKVMMSFCFHQNIIKDVDKSSSASEFF